MTRDLKAAAAHLTPDSNALLISPRASSSVGSLALPSSDGGDVEGSKSKIGGRREAGLKVAMLACACLLSIGR